MPDPGYPWETLYTQIGGDGRSWELVYRNSQTGDTMAVVIPKSMWGDYGINADSTCNYMKSQGWAQTDINLIMLAMWNKPAGYCGGGATGGGTGGTGGTGGGTGGVGGSDLPIQIPFISNTWLVLGGLVIGTIVFGFFSRGSGKK